MEQRASCFAAASSMVVLCTRTTAVEVATSHLPCGELPGLDLYHTNFKSQHNEIDIPKLWIADDLSLSCQPPDLHKTYASQSLVLMIETGIMYRSSQVARVLGHVGERQQERDWVVRHVRKIPCRI